MQEMTWYRQQKLYLLNMDSLKRLFLLLAHISQQRHSEFWGFMNIQQPITSSHHHTCDVQVEACIKFVKHTIKMLTLIKMSVYLLCRYTQHQ